MVAIRIEGVNKYFGGTQVLYDINLNIEGGELFFLLGPSGCGKTTLLRHIAGFYQPDSGSIYFDDRNVTQLEPYKRGTGMMFQSYALWPHKTVAQNVAFGLEERQCSPAEIQQRVAEALQLVQLEGLGERRIQQLSGGQQQRVALARALVIRPACLLLDEPLSNLDARLRLEMRTEIRRICKQFGLTGIYVTHDREEALSMADRIALMEAGRIVQLATPIDIYRNPKSRMVADFIGETNIIRGTVTGTTNEAGHYTVETAIGQFLARSPASDWQPLTGESVELSIRPETLVIQANPDGEGHDQSTNCLNGNIVDFSYLGSTVQYSFQTQDHPKLKITELNPTVIIQPSQNIIRASVAVEDIVLLKV